MTARDGLAAQPFWPRACVGPEPALIERLRAFGLIEPDGQGGWQPTACCEAELAVLCARPMAPAAQPGVLAVRPWSPRRL